MADTEPETRIYKVPRDRGYEFHRGPFHAYARSWDELKPYVDKKALERMNTTEKGGGQGSFHQNIMADDVLNVYFDLDDRCASEEQVEAQVEAMKQWAIATVPKILLSRAGVSPSKYESNIASSTRMPPILCNPGRRLCMSSSTAL